MQPFTLVVVRSNKYDPTALKAYSKLGLEELSTGISSFVRIHSKLSISEMEDW